MTTCHHLGNKASGNC